MATTDCTWEDPRFSARLLGSSVIRNSRYGVLVRGTDFSMEGCSFSDNEKEAVKVEDFVQKANPRGTQRTGKAREVAADLPGEVGGLFEIPKASSTTTTWPRAKNKMVCTWRGHSARASTTAASNSRIQETQQMELSSAKACSIWRSA